MRDLGGLVVEVAVPAGVDGVAVAALGEVRAEVGKLDVGGSGIVGLALFAIDVGQAVEKEGAVVFLGGRVLAGGVLGVSDELGEDGFGFSVAA